MFTKRVYFIERSLNSVELEGFLAILEQQEASVLLAVNADVLEEKGAKRWGGLSADEKNAVNEQLLATLNALGHVEAGRDTAAGHLAFQGFYSWYYHKFRINFALQQRLQAIAVYKKLLEEYEQVVVYTNQLPDVLLRKNIPQVVFVVADQPAAKAAKPGQKIRLLPQLKEMSSRFKEAFRQSRDLLSKQHKHLFVLNHSHLQPILDPDNLPGMYQDNVFVGYFLREYADNFLLLDKQLLDKSNSSRNSGEAETTFYSQRKMLYNEWVEVRASINPQVLWRVRQYSKHLKKSYRKIIKALKDPLQQLIMQEVIKLHRSSLYFFFIYQAYRSFFRSQRFSSVTLLDEYSPNFRAIIDAAKQEGLRTHAIQHGSLAATNPGYGYTSEDDRFHPWPDRTLVWGEYWKQLLIDIAAYPPESLFVCGQIRTDIIPKLQQAHLDAGEVLGQEITGKFLILFATQPQPDEGLRKRAALDTFTVAKDLPDVWVVVKPHPREKDPSYYHALAREAGCTNYSIHYGTDLFLLLSISHVLVHCYSTVGIEAVYFGLPAIILDYLRQDILQFAAEEVALQALDADGLKTHLLAIINKQYQLDEKKKQAYIKKYACAVDGKVSERTAQALLTD